MLCSGTASDVVRQEKKGKHMWNESLQRKGTKKKQDSIFIVTGFRVAVYKFSWIEWRAADVSVPKGFWLKTLKWMKKVSSYNFINETTSETSSVLTRHELKWVLGFYQETRRKTPMNTNIDSYHNYRRKASRNRYG